MENRKGGNSDDALNKVDFLDYYKFQNLMEGELVLMNRQRLKRSECYLQQQGSSKIE